MADQAEAVICGFYRLVPDAPAPRPTSDFSEAGEKVLEQIKARFSIGKPEQ